MDNSFLIALQIAGPILVAVVGGYFGVLQLKMKSRFEKEQIDYSETKAACENTNILIKDLSKDLIPIIEALEGNEERTKRIEIALMIHTRPQDHMAIQNLLQEYTGNHYIYNLAMSWARDEKITLNPNFFSNFNTFE